MKIKHRLAVIASLASLIVLALLLYVPAFAADNATVTGDAVRARDIPSAWSAEVLWVIKKGTRVEMVKKTEFIETIDGRSAPWYKISDSGWVFGGYVALDNGIDLPTEPLRDENGVLNPAFTLKGHCAFGHAKSEIKKKLGEPISDIRKKNKCAERDYGEEWYYYTMVYKDVVFRGEEGKEGEYLYSVTYLTDAYDFYGLKVGSTIADVERLLGEGARYPDDSVHSSDTLYYSGEKYGFVGWNHADFKIADGKVATIRFTFGEASYCEENW